MKTKTKAKGNYKDMPRNAIPLRDMVIVWNIGGKVAVTTADSNQYPDLIYSSPVRPGGPTRRSPKWPRWMPSLPPSGRLRPHRPYWRRPAPPASRSMNLK